MPALCERDRLMLGSGILWGVALCAAIVALVAVVGGESATGTRAAVLTALFSSTAAAVLRAARKRPGPAPQ